jgi:hypothetical protein
MNNPGEKPHEKPASTREADTKPDSSEGPYTKIVAAGTVILVLLTYALVAFTINWWPFQGKDPDVKTGAAPCKFLTGSVNTCSSRNPRIIVDATNEADSTNCTFNIELQWGDGSEVQSVSISGGPVGAYLLASHTYKSPGTYVIQGTGTGSGECSVVSATYYFTLLGS